MTTPQDLDPKGFLYASTVNAPVTYERKKARKGIWRVVDGLDGIGKGVIERALVELAQKEGRATFDVVSFSRAHQKGLPELTDIWNPPKIQYHTVITSEPTYQGIGKVIREEFISKKTHRKPYDGNTLIEAYSGDRAHHMRRVVLPALESGLDVTQGRTSLSTLCYQGLQQGLTAKELPRFWEELLHYEGNRLVAENAPDLLIIPRIDDSAMERLIARIKDRSTIAKDDNSIFENLDFQRKLNPLYTSEEVRTIFESMGTRVEYLDAGGTLDETIAQTVAIYRTHLEHIRNA